MSIKEKEALRQKAVKAWKEIGGKKIVINAKENQNYWSMMIQDAAD